RHVNGLATQSGARIVRLRRPLGRGHDLVERADVDGTRRRHHDRRRVRRPPLVSRHAPVDEVVRPPAVVNGDVAALVHATPRPGPARPASPAQRRRYAVCPPEFESASYPPMTGRTTPARKHSATRAGSHRRICPKKRAGRLDGFMRAVQSRIAEPSIAKKTPTAKATVPFGTPFLQ